MGTNQQYNYTPQLVMQKDDLNTLPALEIPAGYWVRTYRPGDEKSWENIINGAFGGHESDFSTMMNDPSFLPERVFFICYEESPIATASAWYPSDYPKDTSYLHMVGILPSHSRKGLGLQVSLAALHQMAKCGMVKVKLSTDDFRIPAIKTYLKLGFKPIIVHENQEKRWRDIFSHIDKPDLFELL